MIVRLFLYFFCLGSCLSAQEIMESKKGPEGFSLIFSLPKTSISLIEELPLTLTLTYPDTYHINLNRLRSHLLYHTAAAEAPFALIDQTAIPPSTSNHLITQKVIFTLDPQYTGKHALTFLAIRFESNDSKNPSVELISPIVEVEVKLPFQNKIEMPLAEPLMSLSKDFPIEMDTQNRRMTFEDSRSKSDLLQIFKQKKIPWLGIFALTTAFILIFRFGKMTYPSEKSKEKAKLNASQRAFKKISKLKPLIRNKKSDPFYVEISRIVRTYIEDYYQVKADSLTTEEFLSEKKLRSLLPADTFQMLQAFLEQSDKVKYARAEATQEDCQKALEMALKLTANT